jgi:hypothetical protein
MSTRQLRKLQQQRELEQVKLQEQQQLHEESEEEDLPGPAVTKPSLFASLAALRDDGDVDNGSNASEEKQEHQEHEDHYHSDKEPNHLTRAAKKKKKSKKRKARQIEQSSALSAPAITLSEDGPDDIDAALQELSFKHGNKNIPTEEGLKEDPEFRRVCALLSINSQHLKVANEMRNLFGRTALENHDDTDGQISRGARRRQRAAQRQVDLETALKGHHPGKGLPELTLRRNIFIQGKGEWPRGTSGGLKMEIVKDNRAGDYTVEFRFTHDEAYERVQQQFNVFVEMGDPQNLIGLLQRNRKGYGGKS